MGNRTKKPKSPQQRLQWSVPLLLLAAFGLGVGTTWIVLRGSSSAPAKPEIESFLPPTARQPTTSQLTPPAAAPPDVSQLAPADAARMLANWNYDQQNWTHAIEHYEKAIAAGADTPDVRTDLGNCYRFLGQSEKALKQYEIAQKENPRHENSLFNQISLFGDLMHDPERAAATARDFLARFPQSSQAEAARQRLAQPQGSSR
jgi:tetratricopeptide (TPR) repeat protein